jgi:hypothetical protein
METSMTDITHSLTGGSLGSLMQTAGYRVESVTDATAGVTILRSATSGLSFDIRMGNRLAGETEAYADFTFVTIFNVVGELPLAPVNAWNRSRRFARLQIDSTIPDQKLLVLCMDVVVAGGVTAQYLRHQIGIWDGLIQQLVPWLRDELSKLHAAGVVKTQAAIESPHAVTDAGSAARA